MQPLSVTESTLLSTTRKTRKADDTLVIMRDTVGRQFFRRATMTARYVVDLTLTCRVFATASPRSVNTL